MHIKALIPSILLLTPAIFAKDVLHRRMQNAPFSRRDMGLPMKPKEFFAMPLKPLHALARRQSGGCAHADDKPCTMFDGCCPKDTVCGIYGGQEGCCPTGESCNGVGGCSRKDDVVCADGCCPAGTKCGTNGCIDSNDSQTTGGSTCDIDMFPCPDGNGCCPNGSQCLPDHCSVTCGPSDPKCGKGCCPLGSTCTVDEKCAKDETPGGLSTSEDSTLPTPSPEVDSTTTDAPTTTDTSIDATTDVDVPTDVPTGVSENDVTSSDTSDTSTSSTAQSDGSSTTTTATRIIVSTQPVATGIAAPTAVPGAILGVAAAGVLGILAM